MCLCAFAFFVSSLRLSRKGEQEKRSSGETFGDENSLFGVNDRGEISRRGYMHGELGVARLIDAVLRNDAAPGSVTAFATHNTVGNSPLPRPYNAAARPICAARAARVTTSLKKTLRYRKRRVTFTGARVFLENTFLPRDSGTRSRHKCQPP